MGQILIRRVKYAAENYHFESPEMSGGLNIIVGGNGNGKSTFMNLIYYGLSGKVDEFSKSNNETHSEIVRDRENFVSLDIELNKIPFTLIRYIGSNDITVLSDGANAKVYPIYRSKTEKKIFSDWILGELSIDPVEIFQGTGSALINFRDLMRLIYHNQELNPKKIYKPADNETFISDSELIRKIIFELLIGKTYASYYSNLARLRELDREKIIAKGLLDEYIASHQPTSKEDDVNVVFLEKALHEKQDQLKKIYTYRESLRESNRPRASLNSQINEIRSAILTSEITLTEKNRTYSEVIDELTKLRRLRENVILEVTQISKIIYSHDKLGLFSADTCPYCLREVSRKEGHCVCGSEIEEEQYERFFYNTDEYSDILKSKQKSIETVDFAIKACKEQIEETSTEIESIKSDLSDYQQQIESWIKDFDFSSNSQDIKATDDLILQLRSDINNINSQIDVETKRSSLQGRFNTASSSYERQKNTVNALQASAKTDIQGKVADFNKIYNDLMINTLSNCRSALIGSDDYMPVIDGGMYKEASASVAIRMMYFFSLLKLSILDSDVKYPKLLLIDTPETAGVDADNLKHALSQLSKITEAVETPNDNDYQVILTTGKDKYPDEFKDKVILELSDDDKLLKFKGE